MCFTGDDDGPVCPLNGVKPQYGLLETGQISDQRGELLGQIAPGNRP
jgi:hypothetical protein